MFIVRDGNPRDLGYVIDSWAKSFYGSAIVGQLDKDIYFPWCHGHIKKLLAREKAVLTIACSEADLDVIVGWSLVEDFGDFRCCHYVVVRDGFRGEGIAKALAQDSNAYSHKTHHVRSVDGWAYRPDLVW